MSKHLPVVYTLYESNDDAWKYKHHGDLWQVYRENTALSFHASMEDISRVIGSQGKYIFIDDSTGNTHIVEEEIFNKDKIV